MNPIRLPFDFFLHLRDPYNVLDTAEDHPKSCYSSKILFPSAQIACEFRELTTSALKLEVRRLKTSSQPYAYHGSPKTDLILVPMTKHSSGRNFYYFSDSVFGDD
jgi:hypothetical protein